jgi:hypothetical protein
MARKVNLEVRATWRQRIERQRQSGLTVAEFSRQEGVSTASFYRWQQEVGTGAVRPSKRSPRRRSAKAADSLPQRESSHRLDATFVQLPLSPVPANPWIELMLTDGTLIRLPQQNLAALQAVLRACDSASRVPVPGATRHV